jgi:hypothetical protein
MCSPMVTSSSPLKATYPKQRLAPIMVQVADRVLQYILLLLLLLYIIIYSV